MNGSIHGGDIYKEKVNIDFSVNLNPLGAPESVLEAIDGSAGKVNLYPPYDHKKCIEAIASMYGVEENSVIPGNGSSELFMALTNTFRPQRALVPIPSFYGYEYALNACDAKIDFPCMDFNPDTIEINKKLIDSLKNSDMVFLANPNNPTGKNIDADLFNKIAECCEENDTILVLDECFADFCECNNSFVKETKNYKNLIVIGSFTKNFAIPGVRIGFLICSDTAKTEIIKKHLPEWNLSVFAENAAIACSKEKDFLSKTAEYVRKEREYLSGSLRELNIKVYESDANFILIYTEENIYDALLKKHILIRDCENFRGLRKGFYRIAVKNRAENEALINSLREIL